MKDSIRLKVIEGDGYPLSVAVSDDATKLCISYLYLDKTVPKTNISFYNFSEVGKNEVEFLVGEFNYDDLIAPEVRFLDNERIVVVADHALLYYTMEQYPKFDERIDIKYDIDKVFFDKNSIVLIHKVDSGEKVNYQLEIYNKKSKKKLSYDYDFEAENVCVMKDYVMIYNSKYLRMVNYMGGTRFEYEFDVPLKSVIWISGKDRFTFVNTKAIQQVMLK